MSDDRKLLTLKDVCQFLQLSRDKVLDIIAKSDFPAHKLGRQWRFYLDEVDAWVRSQGKNAE